MSQADFTHPSPFARTFWLRQHRHALRHVHHIGRRWHASDTYEDYLTWLAARRREHFIYECLLTAADWR